ncbi:CLUMA_CG008504, isoform A [Clunio marinus]|uniref:Ribonuclease H1 n=1 Tax=Clunio marinus TaxID=568069 RepID=A0A1J1I5K3_9DIPT|nr:CLUMA_CG008504, isoform A [Clunio marinus]
MLSFFRMSFYAVARGRIPGIFSTWNECESQVKGFSGAVYKKFKTKTEADNFIARSCSNGEPPSKKQKKTPLNFAKIMEKNSKQSSTSIQETSNEYATKSDEEAFLALEEYPDEPQAMTSAKSSTKEKSKQSDGIKLEPPESTSLKKYHNVDFHEDSKGFVHVYTDGSCENNGKTTAAAGIGVFFGDDNIYNISKPVEGRPTNNSGEIQAAIYAIGTAQSCGIKRLNIFTDSKFLIKSVCLWMRGWKMKEWKVKTGVKVANRKDFKRLDNLIESGNMVIKWSYIPAHKGFYGNEKADKLAKIGTSLYEKKKTKFKGDSDESQ